MDEQHDDAAAAIDFSALAEAAGVPALSDAEQQAVLDLTRVVAHTQVRRFAPLVAYALGLTLAADAAETDRIDAVRRLTQALARAN